MKEKKERQKTERKDKMDKGEKSHEKQGIGEQGDGEKLRKRRENERSKLF